MSPTDLKWFQPLWRRVAVLVICVVWAGIEWKNGDQFWALATSALVAYCLWTFFYKFEALPPEADQPSAPAETPHVAPPTDTSDTDHKPSS